MLIWEFLSVVAEGSCALGVIALRGWVKRRLMKLLDDLVGMLGWCVDGGGVLMVVVEGVSWASIQECSPGAPGGRGKAWRDTNILRWKSLEKISLLLLEALSGSRMFLVLKCMVTALKIADLLLFVHPKPDQCLFHLHPTRMTDLCTYLLQAPACDCSYQRGVGGVPFYWFPWKLTSPSDISSSIMGGLPFSLGVKTATMSCLLLSVHGGVLLQDSASDM